MTERSFILTDVMKTGFHVELEDFINSNSLKEQIIEVEGNYYNLHLYDLPNYTRKIALIDCRKINSSLVKNLEFIDEFNRRIEQLRLRGFVFIQSSPRESIKSGSENCFPKLDAIGHIKWLGENSWWWWYMLRLHGGHKLKFDHSRKNFNFLCLLKNRRPMRDVLYNNLKKNNILFHSLFTYHGLDKSLKLPAEYELPFLTDRNNYPQVGMDQYLYEKPYNESICSIVSETDTGNSSFITEKTWKPIITQHLFVIHGPDRILKQLRDIGFQTFSNIFDESYDEETDPIKKINKIIDLCNFIKNSDWSKLYRETKEIREHNYNHFFNKNNISQEINKEILRWFEFADRG